MENVTPESNKKRRFRRHKSNLKKSLHGAQDGAQNAAQNPARNEPNSNLDAAAATNPAAQTSAKNGSKKQGKNGANSNLGESECGLPRGRAARNDDNGGEKHSHNNDGEKNSPKPAKNANAKNATKNADHADPHAHDKKRRKKKTKVVRLDGNENWQLDMKSVLAANLQIHYDRLHPLADNNDANEKIRITPLGGMGEIGGNMTVFETSTDAIIVDVGMSFPNESMLGVDILVPDFDYVRKIKDKVRAVLITHAHEDHIGAMPYFFKEFKFPLYASPLSLGMISNKFDEHGLKDDRKFFRPVEKRKIYKIGDFEVEFIHITHSIIDASALAITTKAGTIIHTGDFKIDHTPIDGLPTDLHRLAAYGDDGVLALLSDSTNSHREGITKSESSVGRTFDGIFRTAKGRVIMSTFSSNIHRVFQAIECGLKYGRKICVIGRSMEKNLWTAMELGYVNLDKSIFIDADQVSKFPDNKVLIVTTGSQGETMSALYRMATDEHKYIKIKPTDLIIISAKAIPGNEASVSTVLNYLLKSGAKVAHQDFSEIHVSGHAAQEEQKLMLRLVKPKFFLPVHGEYNHTERHKRTAMECGIDERNIIIMSDGDQVEVCGKFIKRVKTVKTGKIFIDNQINKQIEDEVVIDRQHLAEAGVITIVSQIDRGAKKIIKNRVISHGVVAVQESATLARELENVLGQFLNNIKSEILRDQRVLEGQIRQVIRKHIFRKFKKYPTIVPVVYLM